MVGIIAPETPDDPSVYAPNGYSRVDRTWLEGFHAQAVESFNTTAIGPQLWREADRQFGDTSSPLLSPEQATEQYGVQDVLKFDQPINAEHAAERQRLVQDQMRRQSIADRSGLGTVGRLSASLLGGAADPVNIAFAVAPEALFARVGAFGRGAALSMSERIAFGAASGSLGNAVLTPAQAYFAGQEGREYGLGEALADITLGAAIGGAAPIVGKGLSVLRNRWMQDASRVVDAMHSVGEPASNPTRVVNSTPETQLEALSTVLQQKLVGMPADLSVVAQNIDIQARMLGEVDNAIAIASTRAAEALRASVGGDMTAAATRRAGLAPFGETGSRIGDTRIIVGWRSNEFGTVAPRDLERMSPLTQTMVPIEETADSATWRVRRAADGRTVEYSVRETAEGQKWSVTMAPKRAPLSRFIDEQAPADLQAAFTRADDEASTQSIAVRADATLKDPDELLRSYAGQTYRAGEQMPAAYNFRYDAQGPIIGDPIALQDLQMMQQTIDAAPTPARTGTTAQALGETTAATRELEAFAAEDDAVLQELRKQGRLTADDEAQFEQLAEVETQYKELAAARSRAVTCFMLEGNV